MKKLILAFINILIFNTFIYANPVDSLKAKAVALIFSKSAYSFTNADQISNIVFKAKYIPTDSSQLNSLNSDQYLFYIINIGTKNGFVIISGDDAAYPILGYSTEGNFDKFDNQNNITEWLNNYGNQISYLKNNKISASLEVINAWKNIFSNPNAKVNATSVLPLLKTYYGQSTYYNSTCPLASNGLRTITGCVATAMTQIMKYYEYPAAGTGTGKYYLNSTSTTCTANGTLYSNVPISGNYDWANMPILLNGASNATQIAAVSKLMYDTGISNGMAYGTSSSGTCYNGSALVNNFYYSNILRYLYRSRYTTTNWKNLLLGELDKARPIWFSGSGTQGGHSWVCDGYDANTYLHMNWGWDGFANGYYALDAYAPTGTTDTFNSNQAVVVYIQPPCTSIMAPTTISASKCGPGTLDLQAKGCAGGTINWYSSNTATTSLGTGTAFTTPNLNASTNYYVNCTVGTCAATTKTIATATINAFPIAPTVVSDTIIKGQNSLLTATGCTETVKWYDAPINGNLIGTGISYTTLPLDTNTTYYTSCTVNACESLARETAIVIVNCFTPAPTVTLNNEICGSGTLLLHASNCTNGQYKWYEFQNQQLILGTDSTYQTPIISNSTNYLVSCTTNNCESTKIIDSVLVNSLPNPPTVNSISISNNQSTTLLATNCDGICNWYDSLTNGNLIATGNSFNTPLLNSTTTYYASCINNKNCESNSRNAATVTVICNVIAPTVSKNNSICSGETISLVALGCTGNYKWYNNSGIFISTDSTFLTPILSNSTTYSVSCNIGACESEKAIDSIQVKPLPILPIINTVSIDSNTNTTLTATGCNGNVNWYNALTNGNLLSTGTVFNTAILTQNTNYYADCEIDGCKSGSRQLVTVSVSPKCISPFLTLINSGTSEQIFFQNTNYQNIQLFYRKVGNLNWDSTNVAINNITISNLDSNSIYEIKTKVVCFTGKNSESSIQTFTTKTCPEFLDINSNVNTAGTQSASNTITSNATIFQNKILSAGHAIILNPGFKTDPNIVFEAIIGGCIN